MHLISVQPSRDDDITVMLSGDFMQKNVEQTGAEKSVRLSFPSLPMDFCAKKGNLFWKTQVDCIDTEGGRGKWKEKERDNKQKEKARLSHSPMNTLFIDKWGQRQRQTTKLRQGDASGKRSEVDGGERRTEKSQVFSSVAQRWCSLRAAARVQRSVPLRHSEPL